MGLNKFQVGKESVYKAAHASDAYRNISDSLL